MNNSTYIAAKFRNNKMLLLVLLTAFLSMQWSTAHIHLAEHHDHDGSHHQHAIEAHAHQSISSHDNSIDSTHQVDDHNVNLVELDHDCNRQSGEKLDNHSIALTPADFQLNIFPQKDRIEFSKFNNSKHRYFDYSTIQLRAPPQLS